MGRQQRGELLLLYLSGAHNIRNFGVSFKILPTELVMTSHDYGNVRTNYKFVAFFEVPDDGIQVG